MNVFDVLCVNINFNMYISELKIKYDNVTFWKKEYAKKTDKRRTKWRILTVNEENLSEEYRKKIAKYNGTVYVVQ